LAAGNTRIRRLKIDELLVGKLRVTDMTLENAGSALRTTKFPADPHESARRFPLSKGRRQHLHQIIDANGCDLTHVTTRTGRPFTLVCKKTTASHEKSRETYARDQENLKRLRAIESKINLAAEVGNFWHQPVHPGQVFGAR